MSFFPSRDSLRGIGFYYANLIFFLLFSIYAWRTGDILYILIVFLSFVSLLMQDVIWFKKCNISPQDKSLIEKITHQLEERYTHELLTEFDLQNYLINTRNLTNLQEMTNEWVGVDYGFRNKHYQEIWQEMNKDIEALLNILTTHVKYSNASNFTVDDAEKGGEANRTKANIYRLYQRFRRIYIQKLPYN